MLISDETPDEEKAPKKAQRGVGGTFEKYDKALHFRNP